MKTYSVLFSAPWHDHRTGGYWSGTAETPRDAFRKAVIADFVSDEDDTVPDTIDENVASATVIWLCEGALPAYIDVDYNDPSSFR